MKPYYEEDGIAIYCGDCLEVMPALSSAGIDATIADPPYGTTACSWDIVIPFAPMWEQLKRLNKANAAIALFGSEPFTSLLRTSNLKWYRYDWKWHKSRPTGFLDAASRPLPDYEDIAVFYEGEGTYNPQMWRGAMKHVADGRVKQSQKAAHYGEHHNLPQTKTDVKYPRRVLPVDSLDPRAMRHPNEKPIALLRYLILTYTNPGDVVLDFTMGSGTTLRAAKDLGRRAIGIEISEAYCEIAARRLSQGVLALEAL